MKTLLIASGFILAVSGAAFAQVDAGVDASGGVGASVSAGGASAGVGAGASIGGAASSDGTASAGAGAAASASSQAGGTNAGGGAQDTSAGGGSGDSSDVSSAVESMGAESAGFFTDMDEGTVVDEAAFESAFADLPVGKQVELRQGCDNDTAIPAIYVPFCERIRNVD